MLFGVDAAALHGVLALNKQPGILSHMVVNELKVFLRAHGHSSSIRAGHGGALDEPARGVLVVGIGQGCRQLESFRNSSKTYRVIAKLGIVTDTLDATGTEMLRMPACMNVCSANIAV